MDLAQQPAAPTTPTQPQSTTPTPSQQQPPPPTTPTTQPHQQQTQSSPEALTTQPAATPITSTPTTTTQEAPTTPTAVAPLALVTTAAPQATTTTAPQTTPNITATTTTAVSTPGGPITVTANIAPVVVSQPATTIQSQQAHVIVATPQQQIVQTTTTTTPIPAPSPKILNPQPTIVATTVTGVPTTQLTWPQAQTSLSAVTTAPTFVAQLPTTPRTVQLTLVNRPPSTLPIVPINATTTATTANIKAEPNKFVCCLLDNGVRCDRVAGNASFSARIQKIIGTKKMNLALDPTVRHAYICEHHKAIITVAKKSTALNKEPKANAKNNNYNTANSNANSIASTANQSIPYVGNNAANFNDLSRAQQLQHPVNLEMLNNQNRLANNVMNNMPLGRGPQQAAYSHHPNSKHPTNQVVPMDVMMSTGFDNTGGGDSIPSSSGGVEVDLQQLQVNTLRRYKRHFRVQTRPGLNKLQLAEALKTHFRTMPIIEKEAITYFVYIVKSYRNKLDHNPKAD